jgi:hypothetical protein
VRREFCFAPPRAWPFYPVITDGREIALARSAAREPCSSRPDLAYSTLPHPYAFIASSVLQDISPGVVMSKLTPEDILSTARRVGWDISAERAQQIAATASPAVEKFAEARKHLNFDHDTLTLQAAREMTKVQPDGKGR